MHKLSVVRQYKLRFCFLGTGGIMMKWGNWLNAVIGLWFILAPGYLGISHQVYATAVSVIVGAIQVVMSIWAALRREGRGPGTWQNWVVFVCGFWFVFHPFLGDFETMQYYLTIAPGIITMALCIWMLIANRRLA